MNTASADDLDARLGIGARAAAIIAGRPTRRLTRFRGILPQSTFDKIKNHIVVAGAAAKSGGDEKKAPAPPRPRPDPLM